MSKNSHAAIVPSSPALNLLRKTAPGEHHPGRLAGEMGSSESVLRRIARDLGARNLPVKCQVRRNRTMRSQDHWSASGNEDRIAPEISRENPLEIVDLRKIVDDDIRIGRVIREKVLVKASEG